MSFRDLIAAAEKGAASVYHAVLATGADVLSWVQNPVVGVLVQTATASANGMLARAGVKPEEATVVEDDIHAALKQLAAADPTVPSTGHAIGALANLAGSVAATIDPKHAEEIAQAAGAVGLAEAGAQALAPAQQDQQQG